MRRHSNRALSTTEIKYYAAERRRRDDLLTKILAFAGIISVVIIVLLSSSDWVNPNSWDNNQQMSLEPETVYAGTGAGEFYFSAWLGKDGQTLSEFHTHSTIPTEVQAFITFSQGSARRFKYWEMGHTPVDPWNSPQGTTTSYLLSASPNADPYVGTNWNAQACKGLQIEWWLMPQGTYSAKVKNLTGQTLHLTSTQGKPWTDIKPGAQNQYEFDRPGELSYHTEEKYLESTRCASIFWQWANDLRSQFGILPGIPQPYPTN